MSKTVNTDDRYGEIVKVLESNRDSYVINDDMKIVDPIILEEKFKDIAKAISAIPCPKCKDIKYLSEQSVMDILEEHFGDDEEEVGIGTGKDLEIITCHEWKERIADQILRLPIPECKKCKELETKIDNQVIYTHQQMTMYEDMIDGLEKEISKLKAHIREQIKISDNHVDEIDKRGRKIKKFKAEIERLEDRNRKLGSKVINAKRLFDDIGGGLDKMSEKLNKL